MKTRLHAACALLLLACNGHPSKQATKADSCAADVHTFEVYAKRLADIVEEYSERALVAFAPVWTDVPGIAVAPMVLHFTAGELIFEGESIPLDANLGERFTEISAHVRRSMQEVPQMRWESASRILRERAVASETLRFEVKRES